MHTRHASKEIAIRVFRTAHELSMRTVAIFSYEDRLSMHRYKVYLYKRWRDSRGGILMVNDAICRQMSPIRLATWVNTRQWLPILHKMKLFA